MSLHGGRKGSPPPPISYRNQEEDNCSEGDSEGEDHSYLTPETTRKTAIANMDTNGALYMWCAITKYSKT